MNTAAMRSGENSTRETVIMKEGSPVRGLLLNSPGIHAWDTQPLHSVVAPLGAGSALQWST